jgi:hypothetical protein
VLGAAVEAVSGGCDHERVIAETFEPLLPGSYSRRARSTRATSSACSTPTSMTSGVSGRSMTGAQVSCRRSFGRTSSARSQQRRCRLPAFDRAFAHAAASGSGPGALPLAAVQDCCCGRAERDPSLLLAVRYRCGQQHDRRERRSLVRGTRDSAGFGRGRGRPGRGCGVAVSPCLVCCGVLRFERFAVVRGSDESGGRTGPEGSSSCWMPGSEEIEYHPFHAFVPGVRLAGAFVLGASPFRCRSVRARRGRLRRGRHAQQSWCAISRPHLQVRSSELLLRRQGKWV